MPASRPTARRAALALSGLVATVGMVACTASDVEPEPIRSGPATINTDANSLSGNLALYDDAGSQPVDEALAAAFTARYPKIKITGRYGPADARAQAQALSSDSPPDVASIAALGDAVENGQLTSLDAYATAYGWDQLPAAQLNQYLATSDGVRGSGSQFTLASGFTVTGLYYNRKLAQRVGLSTPPATVADLDAALAKAKRAGVAPMIVGNRTGGLALTVQMMINNEMGADQVNAWIYHAPGATIDTSEAAKGAAKVVEWIKAGYVNAGAVGRFVQGGSLFYASGNWDAAAIAKGLGDDAGFVLPPAAAPGKPLAVSDPLSLFGIPAKAKNKDAAAAFLNFLVSDEARQIVADNGFAPSGTGAPPTTADALGGEVQKAFANLLNANGQVLSVRTATDGIGATWDAQSRLLFARKASPEDALAKIQARYADEVGH